jgi:hypothetical protein
MQEKKTNPMQIPSSLGYVGKRITTKTREQKFTPSEAAKGKK